MVSIYLTIEGGTSMEDLLKKISEKHGVDYKLIEEIVQIEKLNVYKKNRRNIFLDLKDAVDKVVEETGETPNDHK